MGDPYIWLGMAPVKPLAAALELDDPRINAMLWNPPGDRQSGWNVGLAARMLVRGGDYVARGNYKDFFLELFENGLLQFTGPIDERFCWQQTEQEFRSRPRLHPMPIAEIPSSFLKFYKELATLLEIDAPYVVGMSYINIKGFRLPPGSPRSPLFDVPITTMPPEPFKHKKIEPKYWKLDAGFSPDDQAFELVKYVYHSFNLEQSAIPFFDRVNHTFNFDR